MNQKGTKVHTLEIQTGRKPLTAICLKEYLSDEGQFMTTGIAPGQYDNIMLMHRAYVGDKDLIYAWDRTGYGMLFLGYWNDGVV